MWNKKKDIINNVFFRSLITFLHPHVPALRVTVLFRRSHLKSKNFKPAASPNLKDFLWVWAGFSYLAVSRDWATQWSTSVFRKINCFFGVALCAPCFGCWHSADVIEVLMQSSGELIRLQPAHTFPKKPHFFQLLACFETLFLVCCSLAYSSSFILGKISRSCLEKTKRLRTKSWRVRVNEDLTTRCEGVTLPLSVLRPPCVPSLKEELNICLHSGVSEVTAPC